MSKLDQLIHDLLNHIAVLKSTINQIMKEIESGNSDKNLVKRYAHLMRQSIEAQEEYCERIKDAQDADPVTGYKYLDLENIIKRTMLWAQPLLKENNIEIELAKNESYVKPFINGSRFELERVFQNLIKNSIEALQTVEKKKIIINLEYKEGIPFTIVQVIDSGNGFPREYLNYALSRGFTTKFDEGHGRGLILTRDMIERHDGTIRVENRSDNLGAKITIRLPVENSKIKEAS